MFTKTLLAGAALALAASGAVSGAALANPKVKASAAMASPKQPIPYDQLEAYSKATPKQRAAKDWWAGEAATGASTDTSTTLPPANGSMGDAAASTQVNPPTTDAPPSMPTTPPTNTPPDDMMTPNPGSNLPGSDPNLPPKEPK